MNQAQLTRRLELLRRKEAVQSRLGDSCTQETEEIIQNLEALALEVDTSTGNPLERARNWRHLGDAYLDLGSGRDPQKLDKALSAYKQAEDLLSCIEDRNELMLLNYALGRALLNLCQCIHLPLAKEARRRYRLALETAFEAAPELENPIQQALSRLDRIVELLEERNDLCRQIAWLKGNRKGSGSEEYDLDLQVPEDAALFEQLLDIYHRMSQIGGTKQMAV